MIHTKHGARCERCYREEHDVEHEAHKRVQGAGDAILRALGTGPKTLRDLARGIYGSDVPEKRRKASAVLKQLGDAVESVDRRGTWRLAIAHRAQAEAAE